MSMGAVREPWHTARHHELAQRRWREFHNVRHPLRPDLRVERVLVCPSGVHVVTTLPVDADRFLVSRSRLAAELVAALLPERYRARVRPVLCREDDVAVADLVQDVLVTSATTLEHIVRSSPVVLSTSEINEVALRLDARLEPFPVAQVTRPRRWSRRHSIAALAAIASAAAAGVLTQEVGSLPLPW